MGFRLRDDAEHWFYEIKDKSSVPFEVGYVLFLSYGGVSDWPT